MGSSKVNMKLLPMKGHYFAWNAGTAPVVPFMSIYARQLGFSGFTVGMIYTTLPLIALVSKPIVGCIADKYKNQKKIFLIMQVAAALGFLSMIFLPALPTSHKINCICDSSGSALTTCENTGSCTARLLEDETTEETLCTMTCPSMPESWKPKVKSGEFVFEADVAPNETYQVGTCLYIPIKKVVFHNKNILPTCPSRHITTECDMKCNLTSLNVLVAKPVVADSDVLQYYQLWLLLAAYLIGWVGNALVANISDTICFQILGDKPYKYGFQRMYGALGWGIFSILSGSLVDVFSKGQVQKNYTPTFGMAFGIMIICVIVSYRIQYTQQPLQANLFKDVAQLLLHLRVVIFFLWSAFFGACCAITWNFLFWLLEDLAATQGCNLMSWIKTIEGLTMGIQCLAGELPFFYLSTWILKKLGHIHAMTLVLFIAGVKFILYSVIVNPWLSLPIALLNGGSFGLFYATMATYACIVAPPGAETTTQGLAGAVFNGVGVSLGSFIGGILIRDAGSSVTFRIFGVASLSTCVLHVIAQFLIQKFLKSEKDKSNKNNLL